MTEIEKKLLKRAESDEEGFRISTPPEIADYKARRLKNKSIGDLGCGIGVQSIFFSRYFEHVLAIEMNKERYEIAKKNFKKFHIRNIEIINGDALDRKIVEFFDGAEIIFSDPSRPKKGDEWSMDDLSPSPERIVETYKKHDAFAFDVPVHLGVEKINRDWEKEFISVQGEIKRLSLYAGRIKKYDLSAFLLPSEVRITRNNSIERYVPMAEKPLDYIFEIDPAIWYAGLLPELFSEFKNMYLLLKDKKRVFSTSNLEYIDPRFKNIYRKVFVAENFNELKEKLLLFGARKVFLRYRIENDYYSIKTELEKNLRGKENFYVFQFGDKFLGATKE